jgi:hypothetical protein
MSSIDPTQVFELLDADGPHAGDGFVEWNDFSIARADAEHPRTRGPRVGFAAAGRDQVDARWHALTQAGYEDAGAPGRRPQSSPGYYGAYGLDPGGSNIEALFHDRRVGQPVGGYDR